MIVPSRRVFRFSLGIALAAALVSTPGRGSAHPAPTHSGKFAFADLRAGHEGLDVINIDGTGLRRLAECAAPGCFFGDYRWSPDGRQVAFLRAPWASNLARANFSLFVVNVNGRGTRRLASCSQANGCVFHSLAWSPDGSRILFSRFYLGLYVVDLQTGIVRRLTRCGGKYCGDVSPTWSPDGSRILFSRAPGCRGACPSSPYVMNADGSGVKRLSVDRGTGTALWSPDGRRIVFDARNGIYAMNPDGSHLRLLVHAPPDANQVQQLASWSPDGRHILSVRFPGRCPGGSQAAALWIMNVNGTGQRRLYLDRASCSGVPGATWSPDGQLIAVTVTSGVFVMGADGGHLHRLRAGTFGWPAWQPIQ